MKIRTVVALGDFFLAACSDQRTKLNYCHGNHRLAFHVTGVKIGFRVSARQGKCQGGSLTCNKRSVQYFSELKQKFNAKNETWFSLSFRLTRITTTSMHRDFPGYLAVVKFSYAHTLLDRQNDIVRASQRTVWPQSIGFELVSAKK